MNSFEITLTYDQIEVLRRAAAAYHTDLNEDDDYSAGFRSVEKLAPDTYLVFEWNALELMGLLEAADYAPGDCYRITQDGLSTLKAIDQAKKATVPAKQDWRALDLKVARAAGYDVEILDYGNGAILRLEKSVIGGWFRNGDFLIDPQQIAWDNVPLFHADLSATMRVAARVVSQRDPACSYGVTWNAMVGAYIGCFNGAGRRIEADADTPELAFLMAFDLWLEKGQGNKDAHV